MEGDMGAQVSSPIFIHQGLSGGFHEVNSLARKRDLTWQGGNFLYNHHQQKNQQRMIGSAYANTPGNWNPKSWDWDSTRFVARPASSVSDGAPLGTPSPVAEMQKKGTREESLASLDLVKGTEVEGESLTLKLGGGSHPVEESVGRSSKRVRSGSPGNGASYPMCQVDDCKADLSRAKDYHRRHKVCEIHSKTTKAMVGSQMQRFCQQCSRFHSLGEFDEGKRSCRRRLAGHNRRRRKTQPKDISSPLVYPTIQENYGGGNLNIVDLLAILTRLQDNGVDKAGSSSLPNKDRIIQALGEIDSLPDLNSSAKLPTCGILDLNVSQTSQVSLEQPSKAYKKSSAPPTMDLLAALSSASRVHGSSPVVAPLSGESSESSDDSKRRVNFQEPVTDMDSQTKSSAFPPFFIQSVAAPSSPEISEHSVEENTPGLQLQLFSASEGASPPKTSSSSKDQSTENSSPTDDRSPLSSPTLQRLFPLQSEAEALRPGCIAISRDVNGVIQSGSGKEYGSLLELSRNSKRKVVNSTISNLQYRSDYTSSSGSDHSPSSSESDNQDRTGRIIFKLFGKDPSSFPGTLRTQILSWLSHSPSDMESYIRPGCVVLSIYLSMSSLAWAKLEEDLAQRVNFLIQCTDSSFWRNARFMVHTAKQLVSHKDGKIHLCKSWRTWRAPEIISISPLAVVSGKETSLILRGRNLSVPGTKLHCTYMGTYTSKEVPDSSYPGTFYDDSSVETFTFPGGASDVFGRCFLEVENAFKGNSFPVIVADDKICRELRHLESELEDDLRTSDLMMQREMAPDCMQSRSRELALHFLNELGWLFQRKSISSSSLSSSFSNSRFKFLLVFSVERDWPALVKKLLDIFVEESSRKLELVQESLEMLSEIQLLHRAVKRRCRKMVDLLLHYSVSDEMGASRLYLFPPNMVGPGGITPLHLAASMEDSDDIVDGLTDDPQEIGLSCWSSSVDDDGQSPHSYASMRNNLSYNRLITRKIADRRNGQFSITVDPEEEINPEKPSSSMETVTPKPWSLQMIYSQCSILEMRRIKSTQQTVGFQLPYIHSILAIAAVCVCVCVFLRGSPVFGSVYSFRWENLDFGAS